MKEMGGSVGVRMGNEVLGASVESRIEQYRSTFEGGIVTQ